jgi:hypothetical protein
MHDVPHNASMHARVPARRAMRHVDPWPALAIAAFTLAAAPALPPDVTTFLEDHGACHPKGLPAAEIIALLKTEKCLALAQRRNNLLELHKNDPDAACALRNTVGFIGNETYLPCQTAIEVTQSIGTPSAEAPIENVPTPNSESNPIKCQSERNAEGDYVIVCSGLCSVPLKAPEGSLGYKLWHRVCDNQKPTK